jgi:hypothetical protein
MYNIYIYTVSVYIYIVWNGIVLYGIVCMVLQCNVGDAMQCNVMYVGITGDNRDTLCIIQHYIVFNVV